jgi:nicotinate dehydrogenase subunit B
MKDDQLIDFDAAVSRRDFLKTLGAGLAVTFTFTGLSAGMPSAPYLDDKQLSSWIHIGTDGKVTVFTGKAEVGQNIRTSLAQIVAEELSHPVDAIEMIMGDTDLTPYDRGTFGSRSIPYMGPQLRKAAATAREIALQMAADQWKTDKGTLALDAGIVSSNDGRKIGIGSLFNGKKFVEPVNEAVKVREPSEWKIAGTSVPKVNGRSFVTGQHKYVSDMKLPGMLYGKVLRAPSIGATLVSADISAASKLKDVVVVKETDFIGVAAPTRAMAMDALKAIKADWKSTPQPSRAEIFEFIRKNAKAPQRDGSTGDVASAYPSSPFQVTAKFNVDYIAHVPLEPRAGLAEWKDGRLTVWTGTQRPFGVHEELSELFAMSKDQIRVIQPDTGSGYGGKHTGEAGIEAARLSKVAGKPVKVVWTREEEFMWAYLRPAGVIEIKGAADKTGKLTSWEFHNFNSGPSGLESPYRVTNRKEQFHPVDSPLRQGSYRGLAATANTFARESVMDDLALACGKDPLEFRLNNIAEERLANVLKAAADKFGWPVKNLQAGHGVGLACGTEKGSFIATCAEVEVSGGGDVKVVRATAAFECGAIINPNHLENQIVGSIVQGLGGALFENIDFKDGKLINGSMAKYRVPRFSDVPKLDIVMVNRKDIPSLGAGETPILGIAPAIRNAILHATGKSLYRLPLVPQGIGERDAEAGNDGRH